MVLVLRTEVKSFYLFIFFKFECIVLTVQVVPAGVPSLLL